MSPAPSDHVFLLNAWYPAAWSHEIGRQPFGRTLLSRAVLLFRDAADELVALGGRCPHRFAPLHLGKLADDRIECPYHGLVFDRTGRCVANPHDPFVPRTGVPVYAAIERYGLVWLWMGDADRADPALIPDFPWIDDPDFETIGGTIHGEGHYELYSDNILDLSHAAYLHTGLNSAAFLHGDRRFEQEGDRVWTRIFHPDDFPSDVTSVICDVVGRRQDHWVDVSWDPPAIMTVTGLCAEPGQPRDKAALSPSLHLFTPESGHATWYFWIAGWKRRDDPAFTEAVRTGFVHAFEDEDKPMIREQWRMMDGADFWSLKPVLLRGDKGAVMARRTLARLIADERAGADASG